MVSNLVGSIIIITLVLSFMNQAMAQEHSAGINTENPSQYAVLHLVSPNGDQGLLLPRLTTIQRNSLVSALSNSENGLIVYDNDESQIYYWRNGSWVSLIQSITRSGNTITIENGGSINIGEGTPAIGQGLEWDGANWIPSDPPGIQTLSFSGTTLQILNGNSVDLSPLVDDRDPDPANEIQTLSKAGNTITLSNGGGSFTDDVDDADNVVGNEVQDLSLSPTHSLSLSLSAATADLSPYMQTLRFTSPNLTISGTDGSTVDLSALNTDNQTVDQFDLTGSTLNLSLLNDGTTPYTVDLSSFSIASVAGAAGSYLTNDGSVTSWDPLGTLAQLNTITSAEITDGSISEKDLANTIAGNGIVGGAGIPLSVNLSGSSGLQLTTDQLEMPNVITPQTYTIVLSGTITVDSKGRITNFGASDERLKKDISRIDGVLDKVVRVNGYTYHYKDQQDTILQHGVIAQELKQIFPDLVIANDKGFLSVNYAGLLPILLEAIKEQQIIIENLKAEVGEQKEINVGQESRITAMEGKLDQLMQLLSVSE